MSLRGYPTLRGGLRSPPNLRSIRPQTADLARRRKGNAGGADPGTPADFRASHPAGPTRWTRQKSVAFRRCWQTATYLSASSAGRDGHRLPRAERAARPTRCSAGGASRARRVPRPQFLTQMRAVRRSLQGRSPSLAVPASARRRVRRATTGGRVQEVVVLNWLADVRSRTGSARHGPNS